MPAVSVYYFSEDKDAEGEDESLKEKLKDKCGSMCLRGVEVCLDSESNCELVKHNFRDAGVLCLVMSVLVLDPGTKDSLPDRLRSVYGAVHHISYQ